MKRRKLIASIIALVLALSMLCTAVLAKDYDISEGTIEVKFDSDGVEVKQGAITENPDDGVTITGSTTDKNNYVKIEVYDGQSAEVTLKDLNISYDTETDAHDSVEIYSYGEDTNDITVNIEGDVTTADGDGYIGAIAVYSEAGSDVTVKGQGDGATVNNTAIVSEVNGDITADHSLTVEDLTLHDSVVGITAAKEGGNNTLTVKDVQMDGYGAVMINAMGLDDDPPGAGFEGNSTLTVEDSDLDLDEVPYGILLLDMSGNGENENKVIIKNSSVEVDCGEEYGMPAIGVGGTAEDGNYSLSLQGCALRDTNQKNEAVGDISFVIFTFYGMGILNDDDSFALSTAIDKEPEPEPEPTEKKLAVIANEDGTFTIKGATLKQFARLKVDGKTLSAGDFTLTEEDGALKLVLADAFLAGLEAGAHTAEIVFGNSYALFTIVK